MDEETSKLLSQEWIVSHEESSRPEIVLRTSDFDFPLSRMREGFIFHKDNTLTYNTMGPADKPLSIKGSWEWKDENTLKLFVDENNTFIWKVEKLDEEILKVTQEIK